MPHILFIAEIPKTSQPSYETEYPPEWTLFLEDANNKIGKEKHVAKILEGTWLFDVDGALPLLLAYSRAAENHRIPYKALLIDNYVEFTSTAKSTINIRQDTDEQLAKM